MSDQNVIDMNERGGGGMNSRSYIKIGILAVVIIGLLALVLANVYIVKEGEYKVIRQFGEVVRIDDTPGLGFKIPFVQSVTSLPKYQMTYDVSEAEITTRDKKRMLIDNYALWRIVDPKKMIMNARNVVNAETRMEEFIYSV